MFESLTSDGSPFARGAMAARFMPSATISDRHCRAIRGQYVVALRPGFSANDSIAPEAVRIAGGSELRCSTLESGSSPGFQVVGQCTESVLAFTQRLFPLLLLRDVIVGFEDAFSAPTAVSIKCPTAGYDDFATVLTSVKSSPAQRLSRSSCSIIFSSGSGNSVRSSSCVTRPIASSDG